MANIILGQTGGFYLGNDRKAKDNWNSYCFSFKDILKYQSEI